MSPTSQKADYKKELEALATVLEVVGSLDPQGQAFVFRTAMERLNVSAPAPTPAGGPPLPTGSSGASGAAPRDAKAFLREKKAVSEVQRVAVLAYYLSRHANVPEFKTPDIVALNQEAGGLKIGNPNRAVDNASRRSHYLVAIKGGRKKISAHGEDIVDALPDQAKVSEVEAAFATGARGKRRKKGGKRGAK